MRSCTNPDLDPGIRASVSKRGMSGLLQLNSRLCAVVVIQRTGNGVFDLVGGLYKL